MNNKYKTILALALLALTTTACTKSNTNNLPEIKQIESDGFEHIEYEVSNFTEKFNCIALYAKEYKEGKVVEGHELLTYYPSVEYSKGNSTIPIGISYELGDSNITFNIECGESGVTKPFEIDSSNGIAISIIDNSDKVSLEHETPIYAISTTNKKGITSSLNLSEGFESQNGYDFVIYIKPENRNIAV